MKGAEILSHTVVIGPLRKVTLMITCDAGSALLEAIDCSVSELVLLAKCELAEVTKFTLVRQKVATYRLKDENKAVRCLGRADDFINCKCLI